MARPTKYTPERAQRITQALADGNTRKAAAAYGGISDETFASWCRRFLGFLDAVKSAEAQAELAHVAAIKAASAGGTWQASAWWLERRCPETWGRRDKLEIISSVREMARRAGLSIEDEARAVAEAEGLLRELRRGHS